ncbi:hypothetical protein A3724_04350 [Alcanivorax sp. HI0033]|jgi:hypothetical protein|nr:hypothetical protein A3714_07685 [Alcanivorax sp. HI0007]KZX71158.1 hypothetical protein A3713_13730 [Alcanivorax sp. HI0003]KZX76232.1 hypothetical protein A3717_13030 [Alcanivorax sp. HI0013]KZX85659.1 hypothetical protein A3716_15055 [Alcanivorax sp. HI0011]KZY07980.1 hypothetical protein A3724_04350 [Alcanivorax sp. HI0033]KZY19045.1 hypothetical protein A3725_08740 [Alcanivorax sp. HI0035]
MARLSAVDKKTAVRGDGLRGGSMNPHGFGYHRINAGMSVWKGMTLSNNHRLATGQNETQKTVLRGVIRFFDQ